MKLRREKFILVLLGRSESAGNERNGGTCSWDQPDWQLVDPRKPQLERQALCYRNNALSRTKTGQKLEILILLPTGQKLVQKIEVQASIRPFDVMGGAVAPRKDLPLLENAVNRIDK